MIARGNRPAVARPFSSPYLEAGASIHGADAGYVGSEAVEKLELASDTCTQTGSDTSADVGLFCRLHNPEVMARARMAASGCKGIQRVV